MPEIPDNAAGAHLVAVLGLLLGLIALAVSALIVRQSAQRRDDPAKTIRRCRLILWDVKRELSKLAASREVHDLNDELDKAQQSLEHIEARMQGKVSR